VAVRSTMGDEAVGASHRPQMAGRWGRRGGGGRRGRGRGAGCGAACPLRTRIKLSNQLPTKDQHKQENMSSITK
jgi:hypothetical protein